jgi:uncharacterized C2H2 Zn-finger protein
VCDLCGRTLDRDSDLVKYTRAQEGTQFGCDRCDIGYRRGDEMEMHQRESHGKAGIYTKIMILVLRDGLVKSCFLTGGNMRFRYVLEEPWMSLCLKDRNQGWTSVMYVEGHLKVKCFECGKQYASNKIFKKHVATKHEEKDNFQY